MHNMGDWHWGFGFGFGHWIFGVLLWISVFVLVLMVFKALIKDD